jgi:hypothetical protein
MKISIVAMSLLKGMHEKLLYTHATHIVIKTWLMYRNMDASQKHKTEWKINSGIIHVLWQYQYIFKETIQDIVLLMEI